MAEELLLDRDPWTPLMTTAPRAQISFRFRGQTVALSGFPPDRTLLDWLREETGAKGTKEGCAEGDCGACTVVLCRPRAGKLTYEPVNACILLLGQIDGAELLVVEDLAQGEALHPVQQAMVDFHGSQCGFCTPGIVMSLFAHYHDGRPATRASVNEALQGNLCRCTGYRPIVDAAEAVIDGKPGDLFAAATPARLAAVTALPGGDVFVGDDACFFAAPASESSLAALYEKHPDAVLLGGATDVGLWVTKRLQRLPKIIWLQRIAEFDGVRQDEHSVTFGAGVKLGDAAPTLAALHPDLGQIMSRFGSMQVRASGTVGGSIANGSPIGDLAPALIAAEGSVELRQGETSRQLPLEAFFLGYGKQDRRPSEYVRGAARASAQGASAISRLQGQQALRTKTSPPSWPRSASISTGRRIRAARVAYGGMAATPKRASACEAALAGVDLDATSTWEPAVAAIAADFAPLSDMRATAAYRSAVAANLVRRALTEISGAGAPTRLETLHAAE